MDKLLDDGRGGEGLLDAAGDGGLMTSPLNLAYFYGASPPGASAGPSAPGSPGSDSSDLSSASAASSGGAVESRPRGGARAERPPGTRPGPRAGAGALRARAGVVGGAPAGGLGPGWRVRLGRLLTSAGGEPRSVLFLFLNVVDVLLFLRTASEAVIHTAGRGLAGGRCHSFLWLLS